MRGASDPEQGEKNVRRRFGRGTSRPREPDKDVLRKGQQKKRSTGD